MVWSTQFRNLLAKLMLFTESRAISRYLAAKYADKGTKLLPDPTDLKAIALLEQWFSVELDNYDHFAHDIVEQKLFNVYVPHPSLLECTYVSQDERVGDGARGCGLLYCRIQ